MMSDYLRFNPSYMPEPILGSGAPSMESIELAAIGQRLTNRAWAGGLIDGEGCITIHSGTLRLDVQSTSRITIETLHSLFGGTCAVESRRTKSGRTVFKWSLYGKKARNCLSKLIPYMVEKKKQAQLAVSYYNFPSRSAMRESVVRRISALKRVV